MKSNNFLENDIRPKHLLKGQQDAFKRDIEWFNLAKSEFVTVSCPACSLDNSVEQFKKYGMTYVRCTNCETVYMNPRPTPQTLAGYYSRSENAKFWAKYMFPASEAIRKKKIFRPRVQYVGSFIGHYLPWGALLDVGAGFGTFCEVAKESGYFEKVLAVEPSPTLSKICQDKGIETYSNSLEDIKITDIDILTCFEVIEHTYSPANFLAKCNQILAPGGYLFLTCPNINGFETSVLGKVSDTIDIEHLNYFNLESLSSLVKRQGFEVLEVSTPGKLDVDIVGNKVLSGAIQASPFLERILADQVLSRRLQVFLSDNLLSSHMCLVARKGK